MEKKIEKEKKITRLAIDGGQANLIESIKIRSQKGYTLMTLEVYKKEGKSTKPPPRFVSHPLKKWLILAV